MTAPPRICVGIHHMLAVCALSFSSLVQSMTRIQVQRRPVTGQIEVWPTRSERHGLKLPKRPGHENGIRGGFKCMLGWILPVYGRIKIRHSMRSNSRLFA